VTELEVANVVGMITYQQELDLAALAESFDERDEITDVIRTSGQPLVTDSLCPRRYVRRFLSDWALFDCWLSIHRTLRNDGRPCKCGHA
jgi:hypothetical protein